MILTRQQWELLSRVSSVRIIVVDGHRAGVIEVLQRLNLVFAFMGRCGKRGRFRRYTVTPTFLGDQVVIAGIGHSDVLSGARKITINHIIAR